MAVMDNNITIPVKLGINRKTAEACLKIVELYLNQNDTECLIIENNEPGAWDLVIKDWREAMED